MTSKIKKIILIWGLLCIPSLLGLRGCGTEPLLNSAKVIDPSPIEYIRGYVLKDRLYIEYYINRKYPTFKDKLPETWIDGSEKWHAELYLDRIRNSKIGRAGRKEYVIHRKPLTENIIASGKPIIVQKLDSHIGTYDDIDKYIRDNSSLDMPSFYYKDFSGTWHDLFLRIPDAKSPDGIMSRNPADLKEVYIPLSAYPMLILKWPFAVLYDWVTLPPLLFFPRIDG